MNLRHSAGPNGSYGRGRKWTERRRGHDRSATPYELGWGTYSLKDPEEVDPWERSGVPFETSDGTRTLDGHRCVTRTEPGVTRPREPVTPGPLPVILHR